MKLRSSAVLVWLGAFLAGNMVAGIGLATLLLSSVELPRTEIVFAAPLAAAKPAVASGESGPGTVAVPSFVGQAQSPGVRPPAVSSHTADASPPEAGSAAPVAGRAPAIPPGPGPPEAARSPTPSVGGALTQAPDPQLVERTSGGVLPIIGPDGRRAWQVYQRPFADPMKRPKVVVVLSGLGLSDLATQNAIEHLPPEITLGFSPYAKRLGDWLQLARTVGHEVLLDVPLEPDDPENQDPGPDTLLSSLAPDQNITRLHAILGRVTGYVGVSPSRSARFANVPAALRPILDDLRARGLLVLDSSSTTLAAAPPSLARVGADLVIDLEPARTSIDRQLGDLEAAAKRNGSAVGVGRPFPVTLAAITDWAAGLSKRDLVLAPLTAVVRR